MGRWRKWAAAHVIVLAGVAGFVLPGGEAAAQADVTLDSSSERPIGNPDRNVPEGDASDKAIFTLTINPDFFPDDAIGIRYTYRLVITGGTDPVPDDIFSIDINHSGSGSVTINDNSPVVQTRINSFEGELTNTFTPPYANSLIAIFTVRTTFDADFSDETLTLEVNSIESFSEPFTGFFNYSISLIDDFDGNGAPNTAELTIWDPGTAKIAADDTDIAEDESTTFTVTLAGLRSTDSEGRAVDHWPVRVNFPAGVVFTKNGQTLESDLYDIEISDNIPAADIAVSDDPDNAIIISVRPAAIEAEADEEAGKEVITYTFRPKFGAHTGTPNVAVTLAALTGVTAEGTLTNSIYVPAAARELTFNIAERLGPPPASVITAVSIDDDDNLGDDPTDTIAESGTIVVTVTLNTPIPVDVTDTMVTYIVEPRGTAAPVSSADITAFTETQTSAGAEGSELTFSIEITEDNRIEFNEQGLVRITSVVWNDGADGVQSADSTAGFTIRDNDRIKISTPTTTVSENIGTFEFTVTATAVPVPEPTTTTGVILDRDVTAIINSDDHTATVEDSDYIAVTDAVVVFPASAATQTHLIGTPAIPITIINDGETLRQQFILTDTATIDTAVLTNATVATLIIIIIAPDPVSAFSGGATVSLAESDGASMTRPLTVSRAPGDSRAVVSLGVSGGTVSISDDPDHDFLLDVAAAPDVTDVSALTVSDDNTSATFTIPADNFIGGTAIVTLTFTPIIDADTLPENITFSVTGIEFPDNPDYGVGAQSPGLTITVAESVATLTLPDDAASENDETGHFTVSLTDRLAGAADIVAELSGDANFPGPQDADYDITVFPTGDRVSAIASDVTGSGDTRTLAFSMATGTDAVDVVVNPLADGYDEPLENVVLRLVSATFPAGDAAVEQPDPASRTITIADHSDDVSDATLDKSGDPNEDGPVDGTFTLKLLHAPDEDATVAYTFTTGAGFGILGTNYTASITATSDGGPVALTNAAGTFTIPRANITGSSGGVEGDNPGEASATITITPVNDNNTVSEDVRLTINSITFGDNISTLGDLTDVAICPAGSATCTDAGSQTLRIMDDDVATFSLAVTSEMGDDSTIVEVNGGDGTGSDDTATITLTVGNVPAIATAVEITYSLTVAGVESSVTDVLVAGASVGTGLTLDSFDRDADTASAMITITARDDDDGNDETVIFTVTALSFTGARFANPERLTDSVTILIVDNDSGICARTRQVRDEIRGAVPCTGVTEEMLGEISTLTLTGISTLQPGDFDGLSMLEELNLSGNSALTSLPAGIFDDVLDTLTTLTIDSDLRGNLSFAGPSEVRQNGTAEITVQSSPAFVAVEATITVTFGGGGDAEDFGGLSTQKIPFGSSEAIRTIGVTVSDDATIGATATFAFDEITLIDGNGDPSRIPASSLIVPTGPGDTHTLTIERRSLRLRIRTFLEGALQ